MTLKYDQPYSAGILSHSRKGIALVRGVKDQSPKTGISSQEHPGLAPHRSLPTRGASPSATPRRLSHSPAEAAEIGQTQQHPSSPYTWFPTSHNGQSRVAHAQPCLLQLVSPPCPALETPRRLRMPPRAGTQHADEIMMAFCQHKCFERSYLTHEKYISSPAGKERKKA